MLVLTSFFACGRFYQAGSTVDDNDPVIKGREVFFVASDGATEADPVPVVEQATAAPGERRTVKKSTARKSAAKK